jgi:Tol biopolymer transport system component
MKHWVRIAFVLSLAVFVAAPTPAQVVRQLTDGKTTVAGPGAMDDAGSVVYSGVSADFAGENPGHAFQIVAFDPTTGAASPVTAFPDGTTPLISVSDDGQWLAFPSPADLTGDNHDQSIELFVMSSDGLQIDQLTDDPAPNAGSVGAVVISGDGNRLAFVANIDPLGSNSENLNQLFVIDRDGTGLAQLTQVADGSIGAISISDDGSRIAFAHTADLLGTNTDLGREVFAIDADGTGLRQLTLSPLDFDSSAPALSGNGSKVAFQSNADLTGGNAVNQTEVFVIDWDGSNLIQLTATTTVLGLTGDPTSAAPSITDDGQTIVYYSNQSRIFPPVNIDGNFEIFRIQSNGTGRQQLTGTLLDAGSLLPVVSGSGNRISYFGIGVVITLEVMDGIGNNELDLVAFDPIFNDQPDVSPDGSRTVFVRADGLFGGGQIWRVETDGTGLEQVSDLASGAPGQPSIAADNSTIVFSADSNPDGSSNTDLSEEIFTTQADGSGLLQLTSGPSDTASAHPVVASTGGVVVFDSDADLTAGNPDLSREVFKVNLDGTGIVQLTAGPIDTVSRFPRVDASGQWVVFESNADLDGGNADGTWEVHRVRADGTGLQRLTGDLLLDSRLPDISGVGDRIVYQSSADPLGTNADANREIFLYRTDTAETIQLTDTVDGTSQAASISGNGEWVYFSSTAPIFEIDPDQPSDLYRIPALGGEIQRVGALRAGVPTGLFESGGGAAVVGDSGTIAVFSGIGDFTEENRDQLTEVWAIDRDAPALIMVSKESPTVVSWPHESGPLRYDVIRGDVALLAAGPESTIDLGPVVCLEDDSPDANTVGFEDETDPSPGQAFFYLYRGSQGILDGPGIYGQSSDGRERVAGTGDCPP